MILASTALGATIVYCAVAGVRIWRDRPVCIRTTTGKWRSARRVSREQERRCGGR